MGLGTLSDGTRTALYLLSFDRRPEAGAGPAVMMGQKALPRKTAR